MREDSDDETTLAPVAAIRPCPAAMGMIGVPARRWRTRADLYSQLDQARSFLDTCSLEGVAMVDCAREAGLSLHHFIRLFRQVQGTTPHQYLTARRVQATKRLLEVTSLSVSEIALEVGFGSASALGRAFKQATGRTASDHRGKK